MSNPNAEKWALVTGAGRGIGRAVSLVMADAGYNVALAARSLDQLEAVAAECKAAGSPATEVYKVDLSSSAEVTALAQGLIDKHKGVDILINNAGLYAQGHALEGNPDDWETAMHVNVNTPMRLTRMLAQPMSDKGAGAIITIGSVAAIEAMTNAGAYAATKHAIRGWSLSCYQKLRHENIKVCLINPAFVATDMTAKSGAMPERMIQPDDIGQAVKLVLNTSSSCVPEEINLRLTLTPFK